MEEGGEGVGGSLLLILFCSEGLRIEGRGDETTRRGEGGDASAAMARGIRERAGWGGCCCCCGGGGGKGWCCCIGGGAGLSYCWMRRSGCCYCWLWVTKCLEDSANPPASSARVQLNERREGREAEDEASMPLLKWV